MSRFDLWDWQRAIFQDDRLSAADRHVALTIAHHLTPSTGAGAYPSVRTLAGECRRKPHTIIESIRRLESNGYLDVTRDVRHTVDRDVNRYAAKLPLGTTTAVNVKRRQVVPSDVGKLPLGAHELSKSSQPSNAATPDGASFAVDDCLGACGVKHPLDQLDRHNGYCERCDSQRAPAETKGAA